MSAERPGPSAAIGARRVPLLNIANGLTAARIVLVPVFVLFTLASGLTRPGWQVAACVAFGVASVTDYVDGWIARTYHLVTSFGKVADPIADKALTGAALLMLSGYGRLAWWITIVILAREVAVTGLRLWVIRRGVIPASRGGKIKTVLQLLGIGWLLLPLPPAVSAVGVWIMWVAAFVTVATGLDYTLRALRLHRTVAGAAVVPGTALAEPAIQLAEPVVPVAEPVVPVMVPSAEPVVVPLAEPAMPLAEPGVPLAEPAMPLVDPAATGIQPEPGPPPEIGLAGGHP